jgi:prevent-host-death family protein
MTAKNRRHPLSALDAPSVTASEAKNSFGQMLDRVAREGPLAITRHEKPLAVLVPIDEYRALVGAQTVSLDSLSAEFDALLARMQQPGQVTAMQRAFASTPRELGRAAVKEATPARKTVRARRGRG